MGIASNLRSRVRHARTSLLHTAKLVSGNRFTAPYQTSYSVVAQTEKYALRHYQSGQCTGSHVLLVPPLMVTGKDAD